LVAALASGVILASGGFHSQGSVERLLFGSLLTVDTGDQLFGVALAGGALAAGALPRRRWLAAGFDAQTARAPGARSSLPDAVLMALVIAGAIGALIAVGALLATALLVVPAATARLVCNRMIRRQVATVLVAVEGVVGVWLSVELNAPPGATIAVLGGAVFAAVALGRFLVARVARGALGGAAVAALLLLGAGCGSGGGSSTGAAGAIPVVVTTTQLGDIVRNVGGPAVTVRQILQPNTDPHDYQPRPKDLEAATGAKVVFVSGDNLDAWVGEVVANAGGAATVVDVGKGRPYTVPGESSGREASRFDPHWWHDPRNVEYAVRRVRAALEAADPAATASINRSAGAYLARLGALDRGIASCMNQVPARQRKLVTDHDAFGYFAARYGISVVGTVIPSQTTQAQPSAGELARLSVLIRREGVKAVFPESSLNPKLADAIARQTGAMVGRPLYGDTLGPHGSPGETYIGMERANADAMVRGFTGGKLGCRIRGL
jgi:ABC-type Zn uptake system ZnuABC Zn-binding protein ZnuA